VRDQVGAGVDDVRADADAVRGRLHARVLGRVAAASAAAAGLVAVIVISADLLPELADLGFGTGFVVVWCLVGGLIPLALTEPTWSGSVWGRRALSVGCLVGLGFAVNWLSDEPGDRAGYALGVTVALLLVLAVVAALLAERGRPGSPAPRAGPRGGRRSA
jgi:peptidoglycan/LPS O-acetylase OafA/YrhL